MTDDKILQRAALLVARSPDNRVRFYELTTDANMHRLIDAAGLGDRATFRRSHRLDDSTYRGYVVTLDGNRTTVMMSGIPIEDWGLHRCYIDGNSWMWEYAPGILRCALGLD